MPTIKGAAAIVGIGQTEFSKDSGRSELQLCAEAVRAAIADAGLEPADVDGAHAVRPAAGPVARCATTAPACSP